MKYTDERLDALLKAASYPSLSEEKQKEYKNYMTTEQDTLDYVEEQISDARIEGFTAGKEEGREEGRADSKLEIAKAMKDDGVDINVIVKYTGLTEDRVKQL